MYKFAVVTVTCMLSLTLGIACEPDYPTVYTVPQPEVGLSSSISPALESQLDAAGRLALAEAGPQALPVISEDRARALAMAFIRRYGPFVLGRLQSDHGGAIDIEALELSPRVYFAETPHPGLPETADMPSHKAYGPYYLVQLLQHGIAAVSLAVSAYSTDLTIRDDGGITPPSRYGNEFRWMGIPAGTEFPISPETAVRLAHERTGAKAVAPPRLLRPPAGSFAPQHARWEIELDRTVRATLATGETRESAVVFVNDRGLIEFASRSDEPYRAAIVISHGDDFERQRVELPGRVGFPGRFILVEDVIG